MAESNDSRPTSLPLWENMDMPTLQPILHTRPHLFTGTHIRARYVVNHSSSTILYAHKTPHSHYAPLNEYKVMPNKSFYRIMFHYVVWISHYAPFGVWTPHYGPLKECDLILRLLKWEYPNTLFGVWFYHITSHLRIVIIHITPYRRSVTSHYSPLWNCEWIIYRCLATLRPIRNCEWMIYSCLAALHLV